MILMAFLETTTDLTFTSIWRRELLSGPSVFKPVASLYLVQQDFTLQAQD